MRKVALTTIDNPYDPFTQFDEWYAFDETNQYCSCSLLARIANTSPDLDAEQTSLVIENAIDRIVKDLNPLGIYRKVEKTF